MLKTFKFLRIRRLPHDRVWQLVGMFREQVPAQLAALRKALVSGDAAGLATAAHTLRGSAVQFGAERMADLRGQLEVSKESGTLEGADHGIEELEGEFRRVERFFDQARAEASE